MRAASSPSVSPNRHLPYGRGQRLTRPEEFVAVLKQRSTVRSRLFALHLLPREPGPGWRFGLVVPKRFEARAIGRNAIKRVWRESLRALAPRLEKAFAGHDLVVRLLARPNERELRALKLGCRIDAARLLGELQQKLERQAQPTACVPSSSL